ncbi:MAG: SpoIID/LytB domain-containing protein [Gemmatimonadetes bacterium]|nr:SpoIID/LytB domain-containing protein [Gemmatimonadota bacterium]
MRRWAKLGPASLLILAALGCPRPRPQPVGPEPELRIGLAIERREVALGGDGELFLTDDGNGQPVGHIPAGTTWTVVADSGALRVEPPDGTRSEPHRGISAVNVTEGRFAMVNGRRYRGRINVIRGTGGLTVMNRVPVESYVAGVVAGEIGARRPDEAAAVLSQAIVSRTFALRNRGRWEVLGFDAWADVRDQVYQGVAGETPAAWDAVRRTAGQVVRYRGELIDAYFHSTCGYRTAPAEEGFKTARPRPYLRAVSDASGGGHYYCDISPRFRWRAEWDGQKLRAILSRTLPAVMNVGGDGLQRIANVEVSRTTKSGRVGELRIVFEHGDVRVPGPDARAVLRPEADRQLLSAAFQLYVTTAGGEVTRLIAAGAGAGHGVGLCQWGAIGRARAGQDYRRILATYYPGTSLDRLY